MLYEDEGVRNEQKLAHELNNKKYNSLTPNLKNIIDKIFGVPKKNVKINSDLVKKRDIKPDIWIKVKYKKAYVSVKMHKPYGVHQEHLCTLIPFLRGLGVQENALKALVRFIYCDGTLNGTGKTRMSKTEYMIKYKEEIEMLNEALNKKEIILACAERFLFLGRREPIIPADYIYVGDIEKGEIASRGQIIKYLERHDFSDIRVPHVGFFLFHPMVRGLKRTYIDPKVKQTVQIGTLYFEDKLRLISHRYQ